MQAKSSRSPLRGVLQLFNIAAFFRWWGQGLKLCFPQSWHRLLSAAPPRLIIEQHHDELFIKQEKNGNIKELGRYSMAALDRDGAELPKSGKSEVVLQLGKENVLSKITTLPLATENNLRQVVGFEIDRLTPFAADKVFFDTEIIDRSAENRILKVRFTVALRSVVENTLEFLTARGLAPDIVNSAYCPQANLLPLAQRPRKGGPALLVRWSLIFLIVISVAVAAILPLWQQRAIVVELLPQVVLAQQIAEDTAELRKQVEIAVESSNFLLEKRQNNDLMIELINELTEILPDNTWVEQLIIKGGEVQVRGQSQDATALIALVEASQRFEQATFRSPVTRDRRTQRDRFFLIAQISKQAKDDAS